MLKYIELSTGANHNGPAWIGRVKLSRSGRTVYFNGKALKRARSGSYSGNHYDLKTGDEYWISGIKKNGQDRHRFGSGKIMIDASVVEDYLRITGEKSLDSSEFDIVDSIQPTDPADFTELENTSLY